jgi:general stress protein 26
MSAPKSDHDTLWELIKDIKFGMLTHRHANGMLHAHPLTTQNQSIDEGAAVFLHLAQKRAGPAAAAGRQRQRVVCGPGDDSYVSLSGQAVITEDQAKKEDLWSPVARAWFPAGVNDPDLALLEVRIHHAEYWDVKESKMVQLAKMAKAALTGETPPRLGEHKELHLS